MIIKRGKRNSLLFYRNILVDDKLNEMIKWCNEMGLNVHYPIYTYEYVRIKFKQETDLLLFALKWL